MKNLHIIPTDKPSFGKYLVINKKDKLCIWSTDTMGSQITLNPQHIYITSDEEINKDTKPCWCLDTKNNSVNYYQGALPLHNYIGYKKIILTTDQDLIADGVQAIDDEFLEWFVKNPSCEEVKVVDDTFTVREASKLPLGVKNHKYKIIIPKEEPKQDPLEQAAERILANNIDGLRDALKDDDLFYFYKGVIQSYGEAMANYQSEKMYGEEEVLKLVDGAFHMYASSKRHDAKEWLVEQFKKK